MNDTGKKYRIGLFWSVVLIALAAVADLLSLIPFVGDFVAPIYWICASLYLWYAGCGLFNSRRLASSVISLVAELIPAVQEFPFTLAGIIAVLIFVRIEDKAGMNLPIPGESFTGGQKPIYQNGRRMPSLSAAGETRNPLNVDGVRAPRGGLNN